MALPKSFWLAVTSVPLIALGALSPWAQVVKARIDGPQDEIVLALALLSAVTLIAFAGSHRRSIALVPLLAGAAAAVLTGRDVRDTGDIAPHVNEQLARVDWGLYVTVVGSICLVLASMLLVIESADASAEHSRRRRVGTGRARIRGGIERRRRQAFFARAARFTPYVAVENDEALFFVSTRDRRLGGSLFAAMGRRIDMNVLRRATQLLADQGLPTTGRTFVEVGANIGTTTVSAIRQRGFLRAVAVEPASENFRTLQLNLVANRIAAVVTSIEAAVSDVEGHEVLELSENTSGGHMLGAHVPERRETTTPVSTVTLDGLVERGVIDPGEVGLLWLDAHGNEARALSAASTLIEAQVPIVTAIRPHLPSWPLTRILLLEALRGYGRFVELRGKRRTAGDLALLLDLVGEQTTDILALPRS